MGDTIFKVIDLKQDLEKPEFIKEIRRLFFFWQDVHISERWIVEEDALLGRDSPPHISPQQLDWAAARQQAGKKAELWGLNSISPLLMIFAKTARKEKNWIASELLSTKPKNCFLNHMIILNSHSIDENKITSEQGTPSGFPSTAGLFLGYSG